MIIESKLKFHERPMCLKSTSGHYYKVATLSVQLLQEYPPRIKIEQMILT